MMRLLNADGTNATQSQLESILIQELQEHILQATVYLEEYTLAGISLVPKQNPYPKHTENLVRFTIHKQNGILLHNHVQLPLALLPGLDRGYLPNRSGQLENAYNSVVNIETVTWVAMLMTFYHRCRTPEDPLTAVETTLESPNRCVIVDAAGKVPLHAFWIQVRGVFPRCCRCV